MSLLKEVVVTVVDSQYYTGNKEDSGYTLGGTQVGNLTNAQDNNVLTFNNLNKTWEAQPVKTLQNTNISEFNTLNDGDVLTWNTSTLQWTPEPTGTSHYVSITNDTSSSNDQYVVFANNVGTSELKVNDVGFIYNPDVSLLSVPNINTNFVGGTKGQLVFQDDANSTSFLESGSAFQILQSNGSNLFPTWINQSAINAGTATSAINIANGTVGALPYQTGSSTTGFLSAGSTNQVLAVNGSGAPSWINQSAINAGTATSATNLANGTAGALPYQTSSSTTGFLSAGTTNQVLAVNGSGAPSWINQSAINAGSATSATNLANGAAGALPYQTGSSTTGFLSAGSTNQVLAVNGSGAPNWINQSAISAGTATSATNLANGTAGALLYQSAPSTTVFTAAGTAGQVLFSNGTGAPTWGIVNSIADLAGSVVVASSVNGNITSTLAGTGTAVVQSISKEGFSSPLCQLTTTGSTGSGAFLELYANKVPITAGDTVGGVSFSGNDNSAVNIQYAQLVGAIKNKATDGELTLNVLKASVVTTGLKVSGDAITVPFGLRDGSNSLGTSSFLLSSTGAATQWINQSAINAGSATSATNLYNGTAGALPYQTGSSTTGFLSVGSTNQVLAVNGSGAPSWINQSAINAGSATSATNLSNGTAGALPYQTGSSTTGFLSVGSTNQVLAVNGSGAPSWVNQSTLVSGVASNISGGSLGSLPYQSAVGTTSFLSPGTSGFILQCNGAAAPSWVVTPFRSSIASVTALGLVANNFSSGLTASAASTYPLLQAMLSINTKQNVPSTSGVSLDTSNFRWNIVQSGSYKIDATLGVLGSLAASAYQLNLAINGTVFSNAPTNTIRYAYVQTQISTTIYNSVSFSATYSFNSGDYVSLIQSQGVSASVGTFTIVNGCNCTITRIE